MIISENKEMEAKFRASFQNGFFLCKELPLEVGQYLKFQGWLNENDSLVSLSIPGEGNMNYVLRAEFRESPSIILKQARPWVEKYPHFEAPTERGRVEKQFLEVVSVFEEVAPYVPSLIGYDPQSNILALEDLKGAHDMMRIYFEDKSIAEEEISQVIEFANRLSTVELDQAFPENLDMRRLNHQHIFDLPFQADNGFGLDTIQPGLEELSKSLKLDETLKKKVKLLGDVYLAKGTQLLHGDLYPGSILTSSSNLYVIDPEFSFLGPKEWDIAVFIAHLILAKTDPELVNNAIDNYEKPNGFDMLQFCGFIGVEIIRRLIGIAQLPLSLTLDEKEKLLVEASTLINRGF
ncbi:MAG: aminoglycoside phosphotransferase [Balneola sp.]|nr:MAG: aminoglycoside phosphotransferase [Balneola sp.]